MSIQTYNPLGSSWLMFLVVLLGIFGIISLAEILLKNTRWSPGVSRRMVHILIGVLICCTRFLFDSPYYVEILCVVFIVVNLAALRTDKFAGMHTPDRLSFGTVFYALSILVITLFFWDSNPIIFFLSILILALGIHSRALWVKV